MNCSRCGNCHLDLNLEMETAKRTCKLTGDEVGKDFYCTSYKSKGKIVTGELVCNFPIEQTYFSCGQ